MKSTVCPHLSPDDLLGVSRANKWLNNCAAMSAGTQCATLIPAKQPVPEGFMTILCQMLIEGHERIAGSIEDLRARIDSLEADG